MAQHTYEPMETAPKTDVICIVCNGVETPAYWEPQPLNAWCYWDEEDGGDTMMPLRGDLSGWRRIF